MNAQTAILDSVTAHANHLFIDLNQSASTGFAVACGGRSVGRGLGVAVAQAGGVAISCLRAFPELQALIDPDFSLGQMIDSFPCRDRRDRSSYDDGISDALFQFIRPLTGGYSWCPPMAGNEVDLSALG